jgi:hypothetical protein
MIQWFWGYSRTLLQLHSLYIVTCLGVTIDGVWISELDLLTTCTHHSELQVITALSLISTFFKSLHAKFFLSLLCLQQPFPSSGFNSGNSPAPGLTSLLSNILQLNSFLHSRTSSSQLHWIALSSQPPLKSSVELTQPAWGPRYIASGRTQQETPPPTVFLLLLWAVA